MQAFLLKTQKTFCFDNFERSTRNESLLSIVKNSFVKHYLQGIVLRDTCVLIRLFQSFLQ